MQAKNSSKHFLPQSFEEMEIADHKVNSGGKMCWQLVPGALAKLSPVFSN